MRPRSLKGTTSMRRPCSTCCCISAGNSGESSSSSTAERLDSRTASGSIRAAWACTIEDSYMTITETRSMAVAPASSAYRRNWAGAHLPVSPKTRSTTDAQGHGSRCLAARGCAATCLDHGDPDGVGGRREVLGIAGALRRPHDATSMATRRRSARTSPVDHVHTGSGRAGSPERAPTSSRSGPPWFRSAPPPLRFVCHTRPRHPFGHVKFGPLRGE